MHKPFRQLLCYKLMLSIALYEILQMLPFATFEMLIFFQIGYPVFLEKVSKTVQQKWSLQNVFYFDKNKNGFFLVVWRFLHNCLGHDSFYALHIVHRTLFDSDKINLLLFSSDGNFKTGTNRVQCIIFLKWFTMPVNLSSVLECLNLALPSDICGTFHERLYRRWIRNIRQFRERRILRILLQLWASLQCRLSEHGALRHNCCSLCHFCNLLHGYLALKKGTFTTNALSQRRCADSRVSRT